MGGGKKCTLGYHIKGTTYDDSMIADKDLRNDNRNTNDDNKTPTVTKSDENMNKDNSEKNLQDLKDFLGKILQEQMTVLESKLQASIKTQIQTASLNPMMDLQTVIKLMTK